MTDQPQDKITTGKIFFTQDIMAAKMHCAAEAEVFFNKFQRSVPQVLSIHGFFPGHPDSPVSCNTTPYGITVTYSRELAPSSIKELEHDLKELFDTLVWNANAWNYLREKMSLFPTETFYLQGKNFDRHEITNVGRFTVNTNKGLHYFVQGSSKLTVKRSLLAKPSEVSLVIQRSAILAKLTAHLPCSLEEHANRILNTIAKISHKIANQNNYRFSYDADGLALHGASTQIRQNIQQYLDNLIANTNTYELLRWLIKYKPDNSFTISDGEYRYLVTSIKDFSIKIEISNTLTLNLGSARRKYTVNDKRHSVTTDNLGFLQDLSESEKDQLRCLYTNIPEFLGVQDIRYDGSKIILTFANYLPEDFSDSEKTIKDFFDSVQPPTDLFQVNDEVYWNSAGNGTVVEIIDCHSYPVIVTFPDIENTEVYFTADGRFFETGPICLENKTRTADAKLFIFNIQKFHKPRRAPRHKTACTKIITAISLEENIPAENTIVYDNPMMISGEPTYRFYKADESGIWVFKDETTIIKLREAYYLKEIKSPD